MYKYFADAGRFTECLTRQNWPVAQEQDNAALESAYAKARRQPGEDMLVTLKGVAMAQDGRRRAATYARGRAVHWHLAWGNLWARFSTEPLENTYWKLTRLGDAPVTVASQQREPHVILNPESRRVGDRGCNQPVGSYELHGDQLAFGQMAST